MDRDRVNLLYLYGRDGLRRPLGLTPSLPEKPSISIPKEYTNRTPAKAITSPTLSAVSTVSSSSKHSACDTVSRRSSASTAPSIHMLPPWHVQLNRNQALNMTRIDYDYNLPCEFAMLDCDVQFSPDQFEEWISHSASHFVGVLPPPRTTCIFCDDDDAFFENFQDPVSNWRARMTHIGGHYQAHRRFETARPDFFVIEYMSENGLLSAEHCASLKTYTERPYCPNLVEYGYKTPEAKARERRDAQGLEQRHDLRKEERQRQGNKGKGRKERTHRPSHSSRVYQEPRS